MHTSTDILVTFGIKTGALPWLHMQLLIYVSRLCPNPVDQFIVVSRPVDLLAGYSGRSDLKSKIMTLKSDHCL
jgi:hypothetical protein